MTLKQAEIRVTPAGPGLSAPLAGLHARAFTPGWSEAAIASLLLQPVNAGLLVSLDDTPAGLVLFQTVAETAEILTIGVDPAHRRRGLGRALLLAAEAEARIRGATRMILDVSADNGSAAALYTALGYRETGRRKAYYPDGSDARLLDKALV